jgi:hypothetical protein
VRGLSVEVVEQKGFEPGWKTLIDSGNHLQFFRDRAPLLIDGSYQE